MPRKRQRFFVKLFDVSPWFSLALAAGAWILGAWISGKVPGANGESLLGSQIQVPAPLIPVATQFIPVATKFFALMFCFTAVVSFFRRRRRRKLFKTRTDLQSIRELSWQDFERYVAEAYRRKGYTVAETGPGADGGVDLIVKRNSEKVLVQCKHWRNKKVGVSIVRELFGLVKAQGAANGVLVTSGAFTSDALDFARQNKLDLVDGEGLVELIGVGGTPPPPVASEHASRSETPSCPRCQSPMIKRTAERGFRAGNEFWGCSKFPKCRGTRDIVGR